MGKSTWTKQNLFDPKTIAKSRITFWERLRLLFHKTFISLDSEDGTHTLTRYKQMKGKIYVLKVEQLRKPK